MGAYPAMQPPMPPEIRRQMEPASPMLMRAGAPQAQGAAPSGQEVLGLLAERIAQLEQTTGEINQILQVVHPPTAALLVPIAQAGVALKNAVEQIQQASTGGSPASGAPAPQANPAESPPNSPMV